MSPLEGCGTAERPLRGSDRSGRCLHLPLVVRSSAITLVSRPELFLPPNTYSTSPSTADPKSERPEGSESNGSNEQGRAVVSPPVHNKTNPKLNNAQLPRDISWQEKRGRLLLVVL